MRASSLVRLTLVASTLVAPLACVGSSSDPNAQPTFDGGQGFDARTDFDAASPDSGATDATLPSDAGTDAEGAAPTLAAVTVRGAGGLPKAGVAVIFQDATGALVEAKTTDATGRASRDVAPGSMVTVAVGGAGLRELYTFFGIKDGDEILAVDVTPPPATSPMLLVDLPAEPPGASQFLSAQAGDCEGSSEISPIAIGVDTGCSVGGLSPIVATAYDANDKPLAWTSKKGNALAADGGSVEISGLPAWSTTFGTYTLNATNVPLDANSVYFTNAEITAGIALHTTLSVPPEDGAATALVQTHPGYADSFQPQAEIQSGGTGYEYGSLITKAALATDTVEALDLSQLLPTFASIALNQTDVTQPKVTWTTAAPIPSADGGFVRVAWAVQLDAGYEYDGWTMVFPPGTTTVQAPPLPAAVASWVPPVGSGLEPPTAVIVDADDIVGYDALLSKAPRLAGIKLDGNATRAPILPAGTTLRATTAQPLR